MNQPRSLLQKSIDVARRHGARALVREAVKKVFGTRFRRLPPALEAKYASAIPCCEISDEIPKANHTQLETELLSARLPLVVPGSCNVCGNQDGFPILSDNLREDLLCSGCGASNRKRQIASVVMQEFGIDSESSVLASVSKLQPLSLWAMETGGFADHFPCEDNVQSEYFGPEHRSGERVNGVRHEDVMSPSFADASLDLVVSSEVFEHVPDPYLGHREVFRCLRDGGRHIFTVPFLRDAEEDQIRATIDSGEIVHHMEPEYHGDPLRPDGVLVFSLFSRQMLTKLREIGFHVRCYGLRNPRLGILGNGLVFVAQKPSR